MNESPEELNHEEVRTLAGVRRVAVIRSIFSGTSSTHSAPAKADLWRNYNQAVAQRLGEQIKLYANRQAQLEAAPLQQNHY